MRPTFVTLAVIAVVVLMQCSVVEAASNISLAGCLFKNATTNLSTSLQYVKGNSTVDGKVVGLSLCSSTMFAGCGGESGFLVFYGADEKCMRVFTEKKPTLFDPNAPVRFFTEYRATVTTNNRGFRSQAVESVVVVVICQAGIEDLVGTRAGNVITYRSEKACTGYVPPTNSPMTVSPTSGPNATEAPIEPTTMVPPTPMPTEPEKNITVAGCDVTWNGKNASLEYFGGNATVSGAPVLLSPCASETFTGCGNKSGYIATYTETGSCEAVYNHKGDTTYDTQNQRFTTVYTSTLESKGGMLGEDAQLKLVVTCMAGQDQLQGTRSGDTITFGSETACFDYSPVITTPIPSTPAPEPESGLGTGAIVGIIIACVAFVIIVAVVVKMKMSTKDSEGDYQRV